MKIRPAREEDVEAAAALLNEHSRRLHGTDDVTPADLLLYWTSPDVELGRDILLAASQKQLGVPVDLVIAAEDVGSYKPAHRHWERFFEATTADRESHVHVAASLFHDIAPARELGLRTVRINRLGEEPEPKPDRELTDLTALPDTLEELVPA